MRDEIVFPDEMWRSRVASVPRPQCVNLVWFVLDKVYVVRFFNPGWLVMEAWMLAQPAGLNSTAQVSLHSRLHLMMQILKNLTRLKYLIKDAPYHSLDQMYGYLKLYVNSGFHKSHLKKKSLAEIRRDKLIRHLSESIPASSNKIGDASAYKNNRPLRVAFTINALKGVAGSEIWLSQMSKELHQRNIGCMIYTPNLGQQAEKIKLHGIYVTSTVADVIDFNPSLIHLQHASNKNIQKLINRLDNKKPIFNLIHGVAPTLELPYINDSRVIRYGAVSRLVAAKAAFLTCLSPGNINLLKNFFTQRTIPYNKIDIPRRAAIVSSKVSPRQFELYKAIFEELSIKLDVYGNKLSNEIWDYSVIANEYDFFLCTGKTAIDILGFGKPVILLEENLLGPAVVDENIRFLSNMNFALASPLVEAVELGGENILPALKQEIARLQSTDVVKTNNYLLENNSIDVVVNQLIGIYSAMLEPFQVR
jgi:hypothetical protein